jgi:hypothetical protein
LQFIKGNFVIQVFIISLALFGLLEDKSIGSETDTFLQLLIASTTGSVEVAASEGTN